jgi:ABC-2 type transport system permease protein
MTEVMTFRSHRYRRWNGELNNGRWTWLAIVITGIRLALQRASVRQLVLSGGLFTIGTCAVLYVISVLEAVVGTEQARGLYQFVHVFLRVDVSDVSRIEEFRELLWATVYLLTIKIQLFWVLILTTIVGPGLIARDLRTRALPIYFAKPVTPLTYLAGKWLIVAAFIAAVMLVPNILSLSLGSLITGGLHTWHQTLELGFHVLVSGIVVCLVGGALVLAVSSLTSDHRYAAVGFLAVCLVSVLAQQVIDESIRPDFTIGWLGCVSLPDCVVILTERLFGMREAWEATSLPKKAFSEALVKPVDAAYPAVVLAGWTIVAFAVSYRRIVRFSRSAAQA